MVQSFEEDPNNRTLRILGLDPGFSYIGVALMRLSFEGVLTLERVHLIETKKASNKLKIRAKADDLRRLIEIEGAFRPIVEDWRPHIVSFEESPSIRANPRSTRIVAQAWGACHALATAGRAVISYEHGPKELKKAVTGKVSASKKEMIDTLTARFPALGTCGIVKSKMEHVADAVAAGLVASEDQATLTLLAVLKP